VSRSHLSGIEAGQAPGSWETLARIATALGADLSIRVYPGTGPRLRDALQAAMVDELVRVANHRWQRRLEVAIHHPARGYIDLVLLRPGEAIAVEVHSELRRVEEQLRWHQAKAEGLAEALAVGGPSTPGTSPPPVQIGRLLVLRSTARTRHADATHPELFATADPARLENALAALPGGTDAWPGPALLWMRLEDGGATLLHRPPRGIRLGR
jgi:transcriptional regulator with XRE-family HTH domain